MSLSKPRRIGGGFAAAEAMSLKKKRWRRSSFSAGGSDGGAS